MNTTIPVSPPNVAVPPGEPCTTDPATTPIFAVIIPVYNNPATVAKITADVLAGFSAARVFVIDDGSTDHTATALHNLAQSLPAPQAQRLSVLSHPKNRGKGAALETGFQAAFAARCTHAITMDADGQHLLSDMLKIAQTAALFPEDLIIGERQMNLTVVPKNSIRGRDLSRFWLWLQTGQDVPDSQCGLRVYPLIYTLKLRHWFHRFDFETESLVRHAWGGVHIRSVPITCIYFAGEQRISHFRPFRDTVRGVRLNVLLTTRRLMPWPVIKLIQRPSTHSIFHRDKRAYWSLSYWKKMTYQMIQNNSSNAQLSAAIGVGILIGLLPIYGLQTVIAIWVADRLHLNLPATLLGTEISITPTMPFWLLLSLETGHLLLHGAFVPWNFSGWTGLSVSGFFEMLGDEFLPSFLLGGLVVAMAFGTIGLLLTRAALNHWRPAGRSLFTMSVNTISETPVTDSASSLSQARPPG
ncbi:MAG: DUF2062 domain-containing protein [Phycisphaerae bacterium]|nr:DUF2062 domain-containing protein [Phycisphaerae bacterium]